MLLLLEDDSMAVRLASIEAMSVFAVRCGVIRQQVLRLLIDMLNDEIDDVRIAALNGIARFNQKALTLSDYEVETVLFNLNEDNQQLRSHIYDLFGATLIPAKNEALLLKLVERLIACLWKHQGEDTYKIYAVMRSLGAQEAHATIILDNYHKLLGFEKGYLPVEPHQDDPAYIARVILIYHAALAKNKPVDVAVFKISECLDEAPFFLEKHISYFKDKHWRSFSPTQENDTPKPIGLQRFSSSVVGPIESTEGEAALLERVSKLLAEPTKINLRHLSLLTSNSMTQIRTMIARHSLRELTQNPLDQKLTFVHMLTKMATAQRKGQVGQLCVLLL